MAKRHSSRSGRARRNSGDSADSSPPSGQAAGIPLSLDEILGRFSDALAFVETAHAALDDDYDDASIAPAVLTLKHGLERLLDVYLEFDFALVKMRERVP